MKITAFFFDFGGTLDSDGVPWRPRFFRIYKKRFPRLAAGDFDKAFYFSDDNLHKRHNLKNTGFAETVRLQVNDVFEALGLVAEKAKKEIAEEFIGDARKNLEKAGRLFSFLKSRNLKIGAVSNFYGNLEKVLESEGLLGYFDAIADSTAVGALKPEKEIFLHALKEAGVRAEESFMVGDSLKRDMKGAENSGMRHIWVRNADSKENPCCREVLIVREILEIKDLGLW